MFLNLTSERLGGDDFSQALKNSRWKLSKKKNIQCHSLGFLFLHNSRNTQPHTITGF